MQYLIGTRVFATAGIISTARDLLRLTEGVESILKCGRRLVWKGTVRPSAAFFIFATT